LEACQGAHDIGGPVRRIVVDKNGFPANVGERAGQALDHQRDIVAFVEDRNDDR
jgi:hypothetical protein